MVLLSDRLQYVLTSETLEQDSASDTQMLMFAIYTQLDWLFIIDDYCLLFDLQK